MPIIKSAIKRAKQTLKRRDRNVTIKKDIKGATKAFYAAPSAATLSAAHSEIDTAVKKGLLKQNTAARRKAKLARDAKAASVTLSAKSTPKKMSTPAATAKKPAGTKATTKPATAKPAAVKKPAAKKPAAKTPVAKKAAAPKKAA